MRQVREVAVAQARTALAEALAAENEAVAAEAAQTEAIAREVSAVAEAGDTGLLTDALHRWVAQARQRQAEAQGLRAAAEAAVAEAREALTAARVDEALILELIEQQKAEARAKEEKRAQAELLELILTRSRNDD